MDVVLSMLDGDVAVETVTDASGRGDVTVVWWTGRVWCEREPWSPHLSTAWPDGAPAVHWWHGWNFVASPQCGVCGWDVDPIGRACTGRLSGASLVNAAKAVSLGVAKARGRWAAAIVDRLTDEANDHALDVDLPPLGGMALPGVGVADNGDVVAWDYDPLGPTWPLIEVRVPRR